MYQENRWDAAKRQLWIKTTPTGEWRLANAQQTIEWLADHVAFLEESLAEPARVIAPYGMVGSRPRELHECD